jgi:hypothetical protein
MSGNLVDPLLVLLRRHEAANSAYDAAADRSARHIREAIEKDRADRGESGSTTIDQRDHSTSAAHTTPTGGAASSASQRRGRSAGSLLLRPATCASFG